jgi:glycerol-3-phosphate dehydrogenase (NAD(P)+)
MGVEMPICEQVYEVLYNKKSAKEAALTLLARNQTKE